MERIDTTDRNSYQDRIEMDNNSELPGPFATGKKIIIIGAGIAGLSFAIAIRRQWRVQNPDARPPTITIYERDAKEPGAERKGYSISIRSDKPSEGMQTLQKLGILDTALRESVSGSEKSPGVFCHWDNEWNLVMQSDFTPPEGLSVASMRIARNVLRRIMLDALEDEVHWGTTCTVVEKLENGRVAALLSNGWVEECDLLVVADGAKSKIRTRVRPDDKLKFAGPVYIRGVARFEARVPKPVEHDYGMVLEGRGTGLFVSPIDEHSALWSLSYLADMPRGQSKAPLPQQQAEELVEEALERGKHFSEPFETILRASDLSTVVTDNAWDKEPFQHVGNELKDKCIVFLGDANHAMSSFSGNGANMALMDGWDLAEQLCKGESISSALAAYDALSMPRAKEAIATSRRTMDLAHKKK
jgi:2-polyprenyl-6-methoxyphenol hydroxylase-like FAD-dependent oxidoreductase